MCREETLLVLAGFFSIAGNVTAFRESGGSIARKGHPEVLVRDEYLAGIGLY